MKSKIILIGTLSLSSLAFSVDLTTDTGTFTLDANEQNFYILGSGFAGSTAVPPTFSVSEVLSYSPILTTSATATLTTDTTSSSTEGIIFDPVMTTQATVTIT